MGINLRLASSPNGLKNVGPINMGGGANLIERSLFASNTPLLPYSQWYVPGNGSPAISTSDYMLMNGFYKSRPYDLDGMGSEGAAIKAREGGQRYVWVAWGDHTGDFAGSADLMIGYSKDPHILPDPTTLRTLYIQGTGTNVTDQNGAAQNSAIIYQVPFLVYNPDPGAFAPFYIYAEGSANGFQHELMLITTTDFLTYTFQGPAIPTTAFGGWSSYGQPQRLGVNNWVVYALGELDGISSFPIPSTFKYTSTDGWAWTPDYSKTALYVNPVVTIAGQDWMIIKEAGSVNDYLALASVNSDREYTGTIARISSAFGPSAAADGAFSAPSVYPGPTFFQDIEAYSEDGITTIYLSRGFPTGLHDGTNSGPFLNNFPNTFVITGSISSNVLTVDSVPPGMPPLAAPFRIKEAVGTKPFISGQLTGTPGGVGTYSMGGTPANRALGNLTVFTNGGLWHQFIDLYFLITDPTAAANAAPLGVKADCVGGTVTISWNNVPTGITRRVYRGTTVGTQATLIGDTSSTSVTDTPTPGSQYFYKVVTLNGGVEQLSRVVSVYAS